MIYFLIPVYNEVENLEQLVKNISKFLKGRKQIIIADDGSTDTTREVIIKLAKKYPVKRVGYNKNRGAGHAFKYGFNLLIPKLKNEDLVVTMEGDNTSDYTILKRMLSLARKNQVVLASPHAKGGSFVGVGRMRILLSEYASYLDSLIFRVKNVKTYSSFYRIYTAEALKKLKNRYKENFITHDGFSAGIEILIKLKKLNVQIIEVPAKVDWTKRKGKSKMNITKNSANHIKLYKEYLLGQFYD